MGTGCLCNRHAGASTPVPEIVAHRDRIVYVIYGQSSIIQRLSRNLVCQLSMRCRIISPIPGLCNSYDTYFIHYVTPGNSLLLYDHYLTPERLEILNVQIVALPLVTKDSFYPHSNPNAIQVDLSK